MNSKNGCTGAPIFYPDQGNYQLLGIHCAKFKGKEKAGVVINERLFETLRRAATVTTINFASRNILTQTFPVG